MRPTCTHVAIFARDVRTRCHLLPTLRRLARMHRRVDDGVTVVWLAEGERDDPFVIVIIGVEHAGIRSIQRRSLTSVTRSNLATGRRGREPGRRELPGQSAPRRRSRRRVLLHPARSGRQSRRVLFRPSPSARNLTPSRACHSSAPKRCATMVRCPSIANARASWPPKTAASGTS